MGDEPEDHPLPQALGTHAYPLPRGAVCGPCNAYLSDLDQNFCNHHHIASLIVFGVVHGTDGRIRKRVHTGMSFDAANQHLELNAGRASMEDGAFVLRDDGNTKFDDWKFSRALHRAALGILSRGSGTECVLGSRYDAARAYIRRPRGRDEFWPYAQRPTDRLLGNRSFPRLLAAQGVKFGFAIDETAAYAYMNLFVDEFIVALEGDLSALTDSDRDRLALAGGTPVPLSKRSWQFHDSPNSGKTITLSPAWFRQQLGE